MELSQRLLLHGLGMWNLRGHTKAVLSVGRVSCRYAGRVIVSPSGGHRGSRRRVAVLISSRSGHLSSKKKIFCSARVLEPLGKAKYEFRDDGPDIEVRVPLPLFEDGAVRITAQNVAVHALPTSLVVGLQTSEGIRLLVDEHSLYGRIRTEETVWFVDEKEVFLSLKKMDAEVTWPELVESWKSLSEGVTKLLKGISVYIVGQSTEINWAVAQELAIGLGYVPLQTKKLMDELMKSTEQTFSADDEVAEAEGAILNSLSSHVRCVVATLGESHGVAASHRGWRSMHAGFSVWLFQSCAEDEASALEETGKAKQGQRPYSAADVVVALSGWDNSAIRPTAEGALRALKYLIEAEKDLPGKKNLYMRMGCRGDWPEIMPPGWDPLVQMKH